MSTSHRYRAQSISNGAREQRNTQHIVVGQFVSGVGSYVVVPSEDVQGQRVVKRITSIQVGDNSSSAASLILVPQGGNISSFAPEWNTDPRYYWGKVPSSVVAVTAVGANGNTRVTHNAQVILNSGDVLVCYHDGAQSISYEIDIGYVNVR